MFFDDYGNGKICGSHIDPRYIYCLTNKVVKVPGKSFPSANYVFTLDFIKFPES